MAIQKTLELPFDPSTTPLGLSSSLTELESALSPLLSKDWAGQMASLSPLERAKMDVMMAYTIVDLIWVYLKMKGVDPASHEVSPELERVREYYGKIRKIEDPASGARTHKIDVPAAGRFILNGIPQSQRILPHSTQDLPESSAAGAAQVGRERAAREQQESMDRMGKAGRMRFIPREAERVELGAEAEDETMGGGDGEDEVDEEEEEEVLEAIGLSEEDDFEMLDGNPAAGVGTHTLAGEAEDLFSEIDKGLAKAKRKRAEHF